MYPWHERLKSWAQGTGLRIDALGLVTLLGAEEMDRSIGRLMSSEYFDYLPLLGAFVVAGNRFTERKTGFTLYNITAGIVTHELAGWVSRWIQTQDLHKVRSKVTWEVVDRPRRWKWIKFIVGFVMISLPLHGILIAFTVLSADWWGFANVVAMIISVIVRCAQVSENQAGIDKNVLDARKVAQDKMSEYDQAMAKIEERRRKGENMEGIKLPSEPTDFDIAKVIVVTEESKVVTLAAPNYLVKSIFTAYPRIPNRLLYLFCRIIGWIAFAVHVISIGMAELPTQICSVVLIIVATVLTGYNVGCEDSKLWLNIRKKMGYSPCEDQPLTCWVTSKLKVTISSYPEEWTRWSPPPKEQVHQRIEEVQEKGSKRSWGRKKTSVDIESPPPHNSPEPIQERRQDLYVWLDLTKEQDDCLSAWGLIPHSAEWKNGYQEKKKIHRQRTLAMTGPARTL
ncbi:hypothetical protein N7532_000336 [Penicillium argentinense]|uniref:Uncharacterized protein n=1 Tax=Penicillium argentinense TaxID=1131581 RepID=A0A9W9KNR9_9EURO|nr:uncharacterized protein N7532_000336 [Penicillium argentinense]KAJ5112291.1 hypothetical protein N7532_000336 [Penicillium argentinense]